LKLPHVGWGQYRAVFGSEKFMLREVYCFEYAAEKRSLVVILLPAGVSVFGKVAVLFCTLCM
jgi:hypothetical protein